MAQAAFPKAVPSHRVNSILTVMGLVVLTESLDECQTELWLLTQPEARHLRRVAAVHSHLARTLVLK